MTDETDVMHGAEMNLPGSASSLMLLGTPAKDFLIGSQKEFMSNPV